MVETSNASSRHADRDACGASGLRRRARAGMFSIIDT